jgi:uncharacterized SAM-binding protein YcdF (DUF218 family)
MNTVLLKNSKRFRKNIISIILGVVFAVYFIGVSIYLGRVDGFGVAMIFLGLLWIVVSMKVDKFSDAIKRFPKIAKILLIAILVAFILSFIIVEATVVYHMRATSTAGADYVVVLGCQVDGSTPSIPLRSRVNAAVKYLKENRDTEVVVTGGQGPGEDISEAEAMSEVLIRSGIGESRIFKETSATSTMENFKFSDELYNLRDKTVVIVSSDYHMFRALSTAKRLGYENIEALPSKSELTILPAYLLREYTTVLYYKLMGRIWAQERAPGHPRSGASV